MSTVLAAGVFDYFHPGHRYFLEQAKSYGDRLVVIIARDENVQRIKNITPSHSEQERKNMIIDSHIADSVLLGKKGFNLLRIVHELQPDILALGYDQNVPNFFKKEFPNIEIKKISAMNPEKWKSSRYREEEGEGGREI